MVYLYQPLPANGEDYNPLLFTSGCDDSFTFTSKNCSTKLQSKFHLLMYTPFHTEKLSQIQNYSKNMAIQFIMVLQYVMQRV